MTISASAGTRRFWVLHRTNFTGAPLSPPAYSTSFSPGLNGSVATMWQSDSQPATIAIGMGRLRGRYLLFIIIASWLVAWGQPVSRFWVWVMKRYMPQLIHPVSGSFVITMSHVPT